VSKTVERKLIDVPDLPVIEGKITSGMILRQHAGEGSLGDTKISLSTTGGLGGCAMIAEVEVPGHDTVYVVYDLTTVVEEIATKVQAAVAKEGK